LPVNYPKDPLTVPVATPKPPSITRSPAPKAVKKAPALVTLSDWLKHAIARYKETGATLGQVATNSHDEALYLLLRTLDMPLDSKPSVLKHKLTTAEVAAVKAMLKRRLDQRVPAAYITREAFLVAGTRQGETRGRCVHGFELPGHSVGASFPQGQGGCG
jgi:hypothetical protein